MEILEWTGVIIQIAGSALNSVNIPESKWCWVLWLIGAPLTAYPAFYKRMYGIFTLSMVYVVINANGVYQWLIR